MMPREVYEKLRTEYSEAMKRRDYRLADQILQKMGSRGERESTVYNPQWVEKRLEILRRDAKCLVCCSTQRLEVDHKIPVYEGGAELDDSNLQVLCHSCHKEKTRRELKERWRKYGGP